MSKIKVQRGLMCLSLCILVGNVISSGGMEDATTYSPVDTVSGVTIASFGPTSEISHITEHGPWAYLSRAVEKIKRKHDDIDTGPDIVIKCKHKKLHEKGFARSAGAKIVSKIGSGIDAVFGIAKSAGAKIYTEIDKIADAVTETTQARLFNMTDLTTLNALTQDKFAPQFEFQKMHTSSRLRKVGIEDEKADAAIETTPTRPIRKTDGTTLNAMKRVKFAQPAGTKFKSKKEIKIDNDNETTLSVPDQMTDQAPSKDTKQSNSAEPPEMKIESRKRRTSSRLRKVDREGSKQDVTHVTEEANSNHPVSHEELAMLIKERKFKNISEIIKASRAEVKHVWVGYRKGSPEHPILIVVLFNFGSKISREELPKPFLAYECIFRYEYEVSEEASKISNDLTKWSIMERDMEKLERSRDKIYKLLDMHSNIEMVGISGVRSRNYGSNNAELVPETCIVIYVHVKGIIPIGEKEFQRDDFDFPFDVQEGKFLFYDDLRRAKEYHHNLVMGCQIVGKSCGTLGGFLDLPHGGVGCLTCAHLFLTVEEGARLLNCPASEQEKIRKTIPWKTLRVGQPDEMNAFGTVRSIIVRPGSSTDVGIDAAIVKVTDNYRLPTSGSFPKDDKKIAGLHPNNAIQFHSGKCLDIVRGKTRCEVIKFGASTDITRGLLSREFLLVGLTNIQGISFGYTLYNQMAVKPLGDFQTFAAPGDSGALVFVANNGNLEDLEAIGMVVGGNTAGETFVTPITDILRAFKLDKIIDTSGFKSFVQYCPSHQANTMEDLKKQQKKQGKKINRIDRNLKETNNKINQLTKLVKDALKKKSKH